MFLKSVNSIAILVVKGNIQKREKDCYTSGKRLVPLPWCTVVKDVDIYIKITLNFVYLLKALKISRMPFVMGKIRSFLPVSNPKKIFLFQ